MVCDAMVQAFRVARSQLFSEARPNVKKIAILLIDGKWNREPDETDEEVNLIKAENVEVFCVGITINVCICTPFRRCKFLFFLFLSRCIFPKFLKKKTLFTSSPRVHVHPLVTLMP